MKMHSMYTACIVVCALAFSSALLAMPDRDAGYFSTQLQEVGFTFNSNTELISLSPASLLDEATGYNIDNDIPGFSLGQTGGVSVAAFGKPSVVLVNLDNFKVPGLTSDPPLY